MKLNAKDLETAHAQQDWNTLWLQAVPLAKLAVRRLMERGQLDPQYASEDLLQDALVAAGEAVRLWQPAKGAFSTWIMSYIRRRALNSIQAASTGMIGGRKVGMHVVSMHGEPRIENPFREDENRDSGIEAGLAYEDAPAGFKDPVEESHRIEQVERAHRVLAMLDPEEAEMLKCLFGIGRPEETQRQYAQRLGVWQTEVARYAAKVIESLCSKVRNRSYS